MKSSHRHVFYHADRDASLKEGQPITLDENNLSYFGKVYWPTFQTKPPGEMTRTQQREFYLEAIKSEFRYSNYASRLQSIFAANTVEEAIIFAKNITPLPNHPIPIFELFAERFWNLDSNWLDYEGDEPREIHYRNYWDGIISNHVPVVGARRPPRLEVMIAFPAVPGKIVHIVE